MKLITIAMACLLCSQVISQTTTFPGPVGIGTTSPQHKLHVLSTDNDWVAKFENSGGAKVYFALGDTYGASIDAGPNGGASTYAFKVNKANTSLFYIRGDGRIGIGTENPIATLSLTVPNLTDDPSILLARNAGSSDQFKFAVRGATGGSWLSVFDGTNGTVDKGLVIKGNLVGVGTSLPGAKLSVHGAGTGSNLLANPSSTVTIVDENSYVNTVGGGILFGGSFNSSAYTTFAGIRGVKSNATSGNYDGQLEFYTRTTGIDNWAGAQRMIITSSGYIGIGTGTPTERMSVVGNVSVNGNISTKKITVTQSGWSDYVFNKNYRLRSLASLEKYIEENKHLPDVPDAKTVKEEGVNVGDTQALLLKKIEELTLYVIRLDKANKQLQRNYDLLKQHMSKK